MKCPKCQKSITNRSKVCRYCGTRITRRSDKMARKMTVDGRIAVACGGLFLFIALVLVIYSGLGVWAFITGALGAVLMGIGKMMG